VKERAIHLVLTTMEQQGERHGVVSRIARQLDIGPETLRHWIRQAEVDAGTRPGTTSAERERIAELEKEDREYGARAPRLRLPGRMFDPKEVDPPDLNRSLFAFEPDGHPDEGGTRQSRLESRVQGVIGRLPDDAQDGHADWVVCGTDDVSVRARLQKELWPKLLMIIATEGRFARVTLHPARGGGPPR
jgi:transposase